MNVEGPDKSSRSADLRLESSAVERLIPSARNARTHSNSQMAEIAGSIRAFGFSNPVLVGDDGDIIAGHGRLAAARKLGMAEVPVIVLGGLTDIQRRQLMLADTAWRRMPGGTPPCSPLSCKIWRQLVLELETLGFTAKELARALAPSRSGLTDENAIPDLNENAVSRAGDIWCAGSHAGTRPALADVSALLSRTVPELMVTDPPYGVECDPA
jgi:ParB-like chromosome segregation protein Spo0J